MSNKYGPKIITDGLVLHLDAANRKSYPGTGTTWYDLSRYKNHGTLINSPTFDSGNGGSIVFDGTNDYVNTYLTSESTFTWCAWFKSDILSNGYQNIVSIRVPNYMLMLLDNDTNYFGFWSSDGMGGIPLGYTELSQNIWYYIVFVREGNSITNGYKSYLNGKLGGTANTGNWSSSDPIILGGRTDTPQYFNGNIAQVSIYNRSLTASEIQQNFNATRGRFGL